MTAEPPTDHPRPDGPGIQVDGVVSPVGPQATPTQPPAPGATADASGSDGDLPAPAGRGGMAARIRRSPLANRLAGGALFSLLGAVLARGLAFVATVLVGRQLDPRGFGEFGTIQLTAGALGPFAGLGLGIAATRALAQWRMLDPGRAGRMLAMALLVAAVGGALFGAALALAAPWLATATLANADLAPGLVIAAALLPLAAVAGVQTGALAGLESFRAMAAANAIAGGLACPALIAGVLLGGRDGAVWGLVAGMAVTCAVNHAYLARELRAAGIAIHWRGARHERGTLWSFSLPSALASSLVVPMNWVCCTFLANRHDGYVQLGLFNAGQQWRQLAMFVPLQVAAVAMPMLARLHGGGDPAGFRRVAGGALGAGAALAATAGLAILLAGPVLMALFGASYALSGAALLPLMAGAVFMTANSVLAGALNARGESRSVLAGTLLYALAAVGISASPLGAGAGGLAVAQLAGSALATAAFAWRLFARRAAESP